jgi:hypothetical protein
MSPFPRNESTRTKAERCRMEVLNMPMNTAIPVMTLRESIMWSEKTPDSLSRFKAV